MTRLELRRLPLVAIAAVAALFAQTLASGLHAHGPAGAGDARRVAPGTAIEADAASGDGGAVTAGLPPAGPSGPAPGAPASFDPSCGRCAGIAKERLAPARLHAPAPAAPDPARFAHAAPAPLPPRRAPAAPASPRAPPRAPGSDAVS